MNHVTRPTPDKRPAEEASFRLSLRCFAVQYDQASRRLADGRKVKAEVRKNADFLLYNAGAIKLVY